MATTQAGKLDLNFALLCGLLVAFLVGIIVAATMLGATSTLIVSFASMLSTLVGVVAGVYVPGIVKSAYSTADDAVPEVAKALTAISHRLAALERPTEATTTTATS